MPDLKGIILRNGGSIEDDPRVKELGPYALAIKSEAEKTARMVERRMLFLNSEPLKSRGSMAEMVSLQLLSGKVVNCSRQCLRDLERWGDYSRFELGSKVYSLKPIGAFPTGEKNISFTLLKLLGKIHKALGSDELFETFTRFFNQSPVNDMMYSMLLDQAKEMGVILVPARKYMECAFSLKEKKLTILISGFFDCGQVQDQKVIDQSENRVLGVFDGETEISLESGPSRVKTRVEVTV
jgi:hypothetical protein